MEHGRSPGSQLVCRSKDLKKPSLQKTATGAIMLQAVSSYKETVESNLKVGKFIPIILLLAHGAVMVHCAGISDTVRCLFCINSFIYRQLNLKRYRRHKNLDSKVFIYIPILQSFWVISRAPLVKERNEICQIWDLLWKGLGADKQSSWIKGRHNVLFICASRLHRWSTFLSWC